MSIAELVFLLLSRKKSLIKFVFGGSIAYGAYAGAIRPSLSGPLTKVDGANTLQGKFKDSFKLHKAPVANVENALELTSLKNLNENQSKFHPSLFKYLVKKNVNEKQDWSWWKINNGAIREATDSANYCPECGTLSDREIIYGDTYFSKKVGELEESELVQDILWSLWEESRYSGTLIQSETIKADLQLDKSNRVPEINQFSLSFKVSNLSERKVKVFRTIELEPNTETEVNILLSNAHLRPMPVAGGVQGTKYSAWNLFPKNTDWKVVKNIQQPKRQTITETHDSLQLLYGSSRFIPFSISIDDWRKVAVNTIDYSYIKEKLTPYLNSITANDVKKDIENWYGGHSAYLLRTRIDDITRIIELLQKKTIENGRGIKESIFERTLNDSRFRNDLYHHFKFNEDYKKIFNTLLANKDNSVKITIEEVVGFLKSWVYQLRQIQDSIKIEIVWNKEPEKVYSWMGQNGQFPAFAFNFDQKITWVKEMTIPLKGRWNIGESKYETETETETGKYKFDVTNKLINIKEVFMPLTSTISSFGGALGGIDIMNSLLPDVGKFIGIDSLKIDRDQSISYNYKSEGTPITLALNENSDLQEKQFPRMNIGWKALDVSVGLNLSKFTKLFYSIYEKLDKGTPKNGTLGVSELFGVQEKIKKGPISFISHAINSIFDKKYGVGKKASEQQESKRPWPVFFQSLFSDPLTFAHSQMMTGYSRLFFRYPEWWGEDNKTKKSKGCSSSSDDWCTNFDFSKKDEIATPINEEIDKISKSLTFNLSMYMPDAPIVLNGLLNGQQIDSFLSKNSVGGTSGGILNSKTQIINVVKDAYEKSAKNYEGRNVLNWDNAKVSFAQLNLKKAIESVLTLPNAWSGWDGRGWAVAASGIQFHKILGEALLRDGFWINVNLMHEYGMFTKHDLQITKKMMYFPNSELWLKVRPDLDYKKLNLGNLKTYLG